MKSRIIAALIAADHAHAESPDYPELVDAVLDAMEQPTDRMLLAAYDLGPNATPFRIWHAMIGAAKQ